MTFELGGESADAFVPMPLDGDTALEPPARDEEGADDLDDGALVDILVPETEEGGADLALDALCLLLGS